MRAEYVAKINGDISALEKTIKEAQGKIQRIADDEVLIQFDYDGNAKAFNKTFQSIIKKHPELTIQLQYDLNKQFLEQETAKLKELETIKMQMDPSDIEGELTDVNKKIDKTKANIELINNELKRLSTNNIGSELNGQLEKTQEETNQTAQDFEKVDNAVQETRSSLDNLYDSFKKYFALKGGKDVSGFWEKLKDVIDAGDQELKELLADWKLLNDSGSLSTITTGGVNSGGLLGSENVLIARTNSKDKEGNSLYSRTNELKKYLDEAYESGVNVARILDIIGDEQSEVFFEVQSKATGNILGSYGLNNDNIPSINPDFLEATDEQILKLIKDIQKLNELGIGVDINPENILYDKANGFSLIDLDLKPSTYKDQAEMIEDILGGTIRTIHDFYEDLGDSSGQANAQAFESRMESIANSINEVGNSVKETVKKTQDSNSPAEESKELGHDVGDGYAIGIREKIPEVEQAAREMTEAALEAIRKTQESDSPSKRSRKLAHDLGDGSIAGLKDKAEEFRNAAKEMTEEGIEGIKEAIPDLSEMVRDAFETDTGQPDINLGDVFSDVTKEEEKFELAIVDTNAAIKDQQEFLAQVAENAFKMDTGQSSTKMIREVYESMAEKEEEAIRATVEAFNRSAEATREYVSELEKADVEADDFAESLQKIYDAQKQNADSSSTELLSTLHEMATESDELRNKLPSLIESLEKLKKQGDSSSGGWSPDFLKEIDDAIETLSTLHGQDIISSEDVSNAKQIVALKKEESKLDSSKGINEKVRAKYLLQIQQYLTKNTKLSKENRIAIEGMADAIKKADNKQALSDIYTRFLKIKGVASAAGEEAQSLFTKIGNRLQDMNAKFIAQFLSYQDLYRYLRQAVSTITELDYALVDLKKTTTMSTAELKEFYYSANDTAKALGTTTEEIINQAAAWSRLNTLGLVKLTQIGGTPEEDNPEGKTKISIYKNMANFIIIRRKEVYMDNLINTHIHLLTPIEKIANYNNTGKTYYKCLCDCGNYCYKSRTNLMSDKAYSCGCETRRSSSQRTDYTSQRFGKLVVQHMMYNYKNNQTYAECFCDCGNTTIAYMGNIKSGKTKSCGCLEKASRYNRANHEENILNKKYGRLEVIEKTSRRNKNGSVIWKCLCDCGNVMYTSSSSLRRGHTKSCGCLKEEYIESQKISISQDQEYGFLQVLEEIDCSCSKKRTFKCKCICGKIITVPLSDLRSGHTMSCGCIHFSKGEQFIQSLLERWDIPYRTQMRFCDCRNKKTLPFDFYLPEHNICIEYQGAQHYQSIRGWRGANGLKQRQINDKIKRQYCESHNIHLICLPYTLSDEEIKQKLIDILDPVTITA